MPDITASNKTPSPGKLYCSENTALIVLATIHLPLTNTTPERCVSGTPRPKPEQLAARSNTRAQHRSCFSALMPSDP